jgi:hypothetical protein
VGSYLDESGHHGYLFTVDPTGIGRFVTLDDPAATPGGLGTFAHGINNAGQIVGIMTTLVPTASSFARPGAPAPASAPTQRLMGLPARLSSLQKASTTQARL